MPFITPEDVSTTRRGSLSPRRRLQAWERTSGTCVVCNQRIDGVRERWIVEHIRALELGGADALENMGPAHEACGRTKTRDDHSRTAQAKRQKVRHLGANTITRPLPGSRATGLKRKINGIVVPRTGGARETCSALQRLTTPSLAPAEGGTDCAHHMANPLDRQQRGSASLGGIQHNPEIATLSAQRGTPEESCSLTPSMVKDEPPLQHDLAVILGCRPPLPDESTEAYDSLQQAILSELKPADVFEAMWAKEIVDLSWEALYLRQTRTQILIQAQLAAVQHLIKPVVAIQRQDGTESPNGSSTGRLALGWITGAEYEQTQVTQLLQQRGLTPRSISAKALQLTLCDIERVDLMITSAHQRRDGLLHEFERKRNSRRTKIKL